MRIYGGYIKNLIKATQALSDETRIRILNLLIQRECCVCEVMQVLDISQSRASRNLNILLDAGFLKMRREGLWSYYSVDGSDESVYRSFLIDAVRRGLENDKTAWRDLENLKESKRLGPQLCGQNPAIK